MLSGVACSITETWWYPSPGCWWGLCLGLCSYCSQGLCWCLWSVVFQRAAQMPGAYVSTTDHIDIQSHVTAGAMPIWVTCSVIRNLGVICSRVAAKGHLWIFGLTTVTVKVCVWYPWFLKTLKTKPMSGSGLPPGNMLVFKVLPVVEPMPFWVAYGDILAWLAPKDHVWIPGPNTADVCVDVCDPC